MDPSAVAKLRVRTELLKGLRDPGLGCCRGEGQSAIGQTLMSVYLPAFGNLGYQIDLAALPQPCDQAVG